MFVVRRERCVECGLFFEVTLEEFIHKLDRGMKLPKRCRACRRKNRRSINPYHGMHQIIYQYPTTKGHRHQVHGGVL